VSAARSETMEPIGSVIARIVGKISAVQRSNDNA
jgi:hypothetical protein